MLEYYLGVDGGGSKTLALIGDSMGNVICHGGGPSSNYQSIGLEAAQRSILMAVEAANSHFGLPHGEFKSICLGLAGVDRPEDKARFEYWIKQLYPHAIIEIVNDGRLVLAAGTPDDWGIVCICGTGSIVIGRSPNGQLERAGGWGYLIGDEGSGYWIGLEAIRSVVKSYDGRGQKTQLTDMVMNYWSLTTPTQLVNKVYQEGVERVEIAQLASFVEAAGVNGDQVALRILLEASKELAMTIKAVCKKIKVRKDVPCALAGGVLVKGHILREYIVKNVLNFGVHLSPITFVSEPARGALRLAAQNVGNPRVIFG